MVTPLVTGVERNLYRTVDARATIVSTPGHPQAFLGILHGRVCVRRSALATPVLCATGSTRHAPSAASTTPSSVASRPAATKAAGPAIVTPGTAGSERRSIDSVYRLLIGSGYPEASASVAYPSKSTARTINLWVEPSVGTVYQ